MKNFSQKVKFMFDILLGFSIVLWFGYNIYHRIAHSEEYNQPLPDYKAIAKNLELLMPPIVAGLSPPSSQNSSIRPHGYTYLTYYYNNPSQKLIETVINNIQSQKSWQEVTTRTQDNINSFKSYCNGEIALNLSDNKISSNPFAEEKDHQRLDIRLYWYEKSDCMNKK